MGVVLLNALLWTLTCRWRRKSVAATAGDVVASYVQCSERSHPVRNQSVSVHIIHTNIIQIVTGIEVTSGNCFPEVWEILPDAQGGG